MSCTTCKLDGVDFNTSGILISAYELPDAVKSDAGVALDRANVDNELYEDAAFSLTWVLTGSEQAENLNTLTRALKPGATLTWLEGGMSSSLTTLIRTVQPAGSEHTGGFSKVTFTGTREPFWSGATVSGYVATQPDWVGTGQLVGYGVHYATDATQDGEANVTSSGVRCYQAQSFIAGDSGTITAVSFMLRKSNSPTGNLYAKVYSHSGTFGTTGLPNSLLATSSAFDCSTLTGSYALTQFDFATPLAITEGTAYFVAVTASGSNSSGSNVVNVGYDSHETYGNNATSSGGAWTAYDNVGSAILSVNGTLNSIGGEVSAKPAVRYLVQGNTSGLAIGFMPYSAYSTVAFDFSGKVNSSAEGGETSSATVISAYVVQSSGALSLAADTGRKLGYLRCFGRTTASYKLRNRVVGENISASAYVDTDPASVTSSAAFRVLTLGPITVPSYDAMSGMNPSVQVFVYDENSSGVSYVDHLTLLPLDHAIAYDNATASGEGVYIDGDTVYVADADGEVPVSQEYVTTYGSWGIPTGQVRYVAVSKPYADAAPPSSGTLEVSWTERFIHRVSS